eukprot:COSAG02_NODE_2012_length_10118_cov_7.152111_3_plen_60_part_00
MYGLCVFQSNGLPIVLLPTTIVLVFVGVAALGYCYKAKKGLFAPKAAAGDHETICEDSG